MRRSILMLTSALAASLVLSPLAPADEKTDAKAKDAVMAFVKALKGKDLDGLLKVCDVPFCRDGKDLIKEREELKKTFEEVLGKRDFSQDKIEIAFVGTLEQAEEKAGKKIPDDRRKNVEEVLGKEYRVVLIEVEQGDRKHKAGVVVRLDGGKVRIVAILG